MNVEIFNELTKAIETKNNALIKDTLSKKNPADVSNIIIYNFP